VLSSENNDILKRAIFISLSGLFETWDQTPPFLLYSAIFILPLKEKWIYHPRRYKQELKDSDIADLSIFQNKNGKKQLSQFIQLLRWKNSQNLVFWMLDYDDLGDHMDDSNEAVLAHHFWLNLSAKLTKFYDPVTNQSYAPLKLLGADYKNLSKSELNGVRISAILMELLMFTKKYETMKVILNASNPGSFHVITSYNDMNAQSHRSQFISVDQTEIGSLFDQSEENVVDVGSGTGSPALGSIVAPMFSSTGSEWFVSDDYDPFDV
jgi:hypothetical protein